jgi:hypothetical protein
LRLVRVGQNRSNAETGKQNGPNESFHRLYLLFGLAGSGSNESAALLFGNDPTPVNLP